MIYHFICPQCGAMHDIYMRMSEYTASGHLCACGAELVRDPKDFCTSYAAKFDGFYAEFPSG